MSDKKPSPKKKSIEWEKARWFILGAIVLFIAWPFITWGVLVLADKLFEGTNFPETSRLGISGDMYGSLNTLFSGLAFTAVVSALFLQRKEIKNQGEQIEQQRTDIQSQIRLMDIQRFENFFYNQISIIRRVQDEVQTYEHQGRNAINMLYINLVRIESNIDSVIANIKNEKNCDVKLYRMDMLKNVYISIDNSSNYSLSVLIFQIIRIRSWIDSSYSLILFIIKNKNLNIEQKMEYLEILKYSFLGEDWRILHSLGRLLNYNKVVEYLLDKGLFEKNEQIEKISEDKIQFIQNEMKLKGNPSLESCEIEL